MPHPRPYQIPIGQASRNFLKRDITTRKEYLGKMGKNLETDTRRQEVATMNGLLGRKVLSLSLILLLTFWEVTRSMGHVT